MIESPFFIEERLSDEDFRKLGQLTYRWAHCEHLHCLIDRPYQSFYVGALSNKIRKSRKVRQTRVGTSADHLGRDLDLGNFIPVIMAGQLQGWPDYMVDSAGARLAGRFKCTRCGSTKTEARPEWPRRD